MGLKDNAGAHTLISALCAQEQRTQQRLTTLLTLTGEGNTLLVIQAAPFVVIMQPQKTNTHS